MTSSRLASIIIPVFNQSAYLRQCLVILKTNTDFPYEIILIDNASAQPTLKILKVLAQGDESIRLIRNETNLGYTLACNQGLRAAKGQYLVFLNTDTIVESGWLSAMVEVANSNPDFGIVGPKTLFPGQDVILNIGGHFYRKQVTTYPMGRNAHRHDPRFNQVCECQYIEGSCMLVRRDVIEKVGGFDEVFAPGYYEDSDYCFRAREAGYKCVYAPKSEIRHYGGITAGSAQVNQPQQSKACQRNEQIFRQRWEHRFPE